MRELKGHGAEDSLSVSSSHLSPSLRLDVANDDFECAFGGWIGDAPSIQRRHVPRKIIAASALLGETSVETTSAREDAMLARDKHNSSPLDHSPGVPRRPTPSLLAAHNETLSDVAVRARPGDRLGCEAPLMSLRLLTAFGYCPTPVVY